MKLVIFDVDGTLIDSKAFILAAMRAAFEAEARTPPTEAQTLSIIGLSLPLAIARLAPQTDARGVAALVDAYKAAFVDLRARLGGEASAPMYPGARAALERLARSASVLAVATGKARRGLDHTLDGHGLRGFFASTQTADDAPSKPHPGMILNTLRATGFAARDAVMIGDTTYDIEMARAAGARAIGVAWGYHPAEALRAAGASAVIGEFGALDAALADLAAS